MWRSSIILLLTSMLLACQAEQVDPRRDAQGHSPPSQITAQVNKQVANELALTDQRDYEDARRGLIASSQPLIIPGPDGEPLWDSRGLSAVYCLQILISWREDLNY